MNEHEGYGKRIYRQRKRPTPYILIFLFLAAAFALFYFLARQREGIDLPKSEPPEVSGYKGTAKIAENSPPGEQEVAMRRGAVNYRDDNREQPAAAVKPASQPPSPKKPINIPTSSSLFEMAGDYYLERNYRKALDLYHKAVSAGDKRALVYVGLCFYWLKKYDSAVLFFQEALAYNRLDFIALKFITLAYYDMGKLKKSQEYAEEALAAMKDVEIANLQARLVEEVDVMATKKPIETGTFTVSFSKIEHQGIERTVLDILRTAHREIGTKMDLYPSEPVSVILYNEKEFFDVTRSPGWAGGLYDGKIRIPIGGFEKADPGTLKRILFHEYAHALVHSVTPECPTWVNEGLALYFSEDVDVKIGQVIPLDKLEKGFPLDESAVVLAYLESYAAVSYLIRRYQIYSIKKLLNAFARGEDIKTAFRKAFMISYDRFLKTWGKD